MRARVTAVPRSRDEIACSPRMGDMARALRDALSYATLRALREPRARGAVLRDRATLHLGGEVREVVMLSPTCADSRSSPSASAFGDDQPPQPLLREMTPVLVAHGGIIDEFIGDAISCS